MIFLTKIWGAQRLWWGFCPQCNSDAPELYDCPVCEYYSGHSKDQPYPPTKETKAKWWAKFKQLNKIP